MAELPSFAEIPREESLATSPNSKRNLSTSTAPRPSSLQLPRNEGHSTLLKDQLSLPCPVGYKGEKKNQRLDAVSRKAFSDYKLPKGKFSLNQ